MYCISPAGRAHLGGRVVSATTRSRPIINTRDEPHADAERYRRLHVIVGDSNMSEYATFLKVGATVDPAAHARGPERGAARHDAREPDPGHPRDQPRHHLPAAGCAWPTGARLSALDIQSEYLNRALRYAETKGLSARSRSRRSRCGSTASPRIENDPLNLDRECDWVIKHKLIEAYRAKHDLPAHPPQGRADRPAVPRRQPRPRPLLQAAGRAGWSSASCTDERHRRGRRDAAADHPGPAAGRVHPPGQGAQARLHGRLGAPEAQRPGPAHRALQGPVQGRATSGSRSSSRRL